LHWHLSSLNMAGYALLLRLEALANDIKTLAWRMEDYDEKNKSLHVQAAECHHVFSLLQLQIELIPHHLQQRFNFVTPTAAQIDDIWMAYTQPPLSKSADTSDLSTPSSLQAEGKLREGPREGVSETSSSSTSTGSAGSTSKPVGPGFVVGTSTSLVPMKASPGPIEPHELPYSLSPTGWAADGLSAPLAKANRRMSLEEMLNVAADMYLSSVTRGLLRRLWMVHEQRLIIARRAQLKEVGGTGTVARKIAVGYIFEKLHEVKAALYLYYQEKFEKILRERIERKRKERLEREKREREIAAAQLVAAGVAQRTASNVVLTDAQKREHERALLEEDENANRYLTRDEFMGLFFGMSTADIAAADSKLQLSIEDARAGAVLGPRYPPTVLLFVRDRQIWSLGVSQLNQEAYNAMIATLSTLDLKEHVDTVARLYEKHALFIS